jgi:hypothetical protein
MGNKNQRISVLVTADEKSQIKKHAKEAGLSIGEFIRRAVNVYLPLEEEQVINVMIDQMILATDRAEKSIDDTINYIATSNKRIEKLEAQHKTRS